MSGSARAGTISREATTAYGFVLITSRSALSQARPEIVCFSLDTDLHGSRLTGSNDDFGLSLHLNSTKQLQILRRYAPQDDSAGRKVAVSFRFGVTRQVALIQFLFIRVRALPGPKIQTWGTRPAKTKSNLLTRQSKVRPALTRPNCTWGRIHWSGVDCRQFGRYHSKLTGLKIARVCQNVRVCPVIYFSVLGGAMPLSRR